VDEAEVVRALAGSELFGGVPDKELRRIAGSGKEVTFAAGEELATTGESAGRYYLILEGDAEVVVNDSRRISVGPGAGIGEVALLDGGPRSATVVASTPLRTFSLAAWNFKPLLERPAITEAVIALLVRRLRAAAQPSAG
jgi:CRP-like cAMP-binding protein